MTPLLPYIATLTLVLFFCSCSSSSNTHREEDKVFHAGPTGNSVAGELYFALYKDNTYQICNSGGLDEDCYYGKFNLSKDTITLLDLDKEIPLKSNRFLIIRYADCDSNYWKTKYPKNPNSWQDLKWRDLINGSGDVYQLGNNGKLISVETDDYFLIRLDSLKKFH